MVARPLPGGGRRAKRYAAIDGVILNARTGYLLSAAGCPIIVAGDGEKIVAAHAGLKSLIRWDASARWHTSVVHSIARCFKRPRDVHAWVFFSIRPEHYTHSTTDERYRAESTRILTRLEKAGYGECIGRNGAIDLPSLIRAQLRHEGITCESRDKTAISPRRALTTRACPRRCATTAISSW